MSCSRPYTSSVKAISNKKVHHLLASFNNTDIEYPPEKLFIDLFNEQVINNPNNIAVEFEGHLLTYKELNEQAEHLAHHLQKQFGIGPNQMVCVLMDRSHLQIVALLGVLKSGGAYVPIDPAYPRERIQFILEDTNSKVLITEKNFFPLIESSEISILELDAQLFDINENYAPIFNNISKSGDIAYVIYTSGTTGVPKGVIITHSSMYDYINTFNKIFNISTEDRVLHAASISFDMSVEVLFPILCVGGTLVVLRDNKDLKRLSYAIVEKKITFFSTTPLVIRFLNTQEGSLGNLKFLISGGEVLKSSYLDKLYKNVAIYNGYGPTESTVSTTFYKVDNLSDPIPIGKPISNRKIYILDEKLNLLPVGKTGELCIAGTGLSKGYLNSPQLTEEKFIENPFVKGQKLYKTGDQASWMPDGNIRFHGRIDNQVKIRGYRIELDEIEIKLLEHPMVNEAAVFTRNISDGVDELIAYVVSESKLNREILSKHLLTMLPDYMIPAHFIQVDKIPSNINGKVDKNALFNGSGKLLEENVHRLPQNKLEENIASMWKKVFERNDIGVDDHFFELGGNSFKAIELYVLLNEIYPDLFLVSDLFDRPTILSQAEFLKTKIYTDKTLSRTQEEKLREILL